jgi:hypothetical protein
MVGDRCIVLARIFHELLSRDHETGNPLAGLSGAQRARRGWACHRATRPAVPRDWFRGVPERYAAGADTRGRQEGRPYPRSQQVIHEISGLVRNRYSRPVYEDVATTFTGWQDYFGEVLLPPLLVDKVVSQDLSMIESQG